MYILICHLLYNKKDIHYHICIYYKQVYMCVCTYVCMHRDNMINYYMINSNYS